MLKKCLKYFFITRFIYISFIVLIFSLGIVKKYDQSSNILILNNNGEETKNMLEKILATFLSYFSSYDAMHFLTVAKSYYPNDHVYAFFPFYPLLIRGLALLINLIHSFENENIPYMLSGFILSNILCIVNCLLLFSLVFKVTNSVKKAKFCVILFLINPGTIFFIAIYTENIYLTLQLIFISYLIKSTEENANFIENGGDSFNYKILGNNKSITKKNYFLNLTFLIIALLATRSNSIMLCSFFLIPCLHILFVKHKLNSLFYSDNFFGNLKTFIKYVKKYLKEIGVFVVLLFHGIICFIFMTKYKPKNEICQSIKKGINYGLKKYDLFRYWCFGNRTISTHFVNKNVLGYDSDNLANKNLENNLNTVKRISDLYSYIQKEYWGLGFLTQYHPRNFIRVILALPMDILAFYILKKLYDYFDFNELLKYFNVNKFLMKSFIYEKKVLTQKDFQVHNHSKTTNNKLSKDKKQLYNNLNAKDKEVNETSKEYIIKKNDDKNYKYSLISNCFVLGSFIIFVFTFLILLVYAHPQIINRMLTTMPIFYIMICDDFIEFIEEGKNSKGFKILLFFITFSFLGCTMHVGSYGFC